ncbi:5-oxoprolinase subunit PxpA [Parvularcula lutaonensis]|uniref:5-oxoprolinase subunit PxpA n=1 Tax=Parvularcula lutaonensis TaxID=491923 RepID=A0ABV7M8W0_9PROT|nr:5-oxoprolinase subunit PxpA [Parvularcula lutaonensis]GGY56893.1 hypothetical protein GCM10007148_28010 [Parvularcula lutaonensis]
MTTIDLNADLGEGVPSDAAMMRYLSSCNIACGGHAGDEDSMRTTLRAAKQAGVCAGAHPSYPDRDGFGRRSLDIGIRELTDSLAEQVRALARVASEEGVTLTHLKPHGALYNDAAKRAQLAAVLASVAAGDLEGAALVGPPSSELARAAAEAGIRFVAEGFCDRSYRPDGSLTPRSEQGAVIADQARRAEQALRLAKGLPMELPGGGTLALRVQTICLHGDADGALETARAVRSLLEEEGVEVRAPYG